MTNQEKLHEINTEISVLKNILRKLEAEQARLISEIHKDETVIISQLPSRGKNQLIQYGIDSDSKLKKFLMGDCTVVDTRMLGFYKEYYVKKNSYEERLATIPAIGTGTAKSIVDLLKKLDFIQ